MADKPDRKRFHFHPSKKKPSPTKRKSTELEEEAARKQGQYDIIRQDRRAGRRGKGVPKDYQPKHRKKEKD